jgi:LmbE family N-acetylglucosaminyl deacetylase
MKILFVVAHPVDELLGLGASIHKLINIQNCKVRAVIF